MIVNYKYPFKAFCGYNFSAYTVHVIVCEAFKGKPFGEFLSAQGLTPLLIRYVLHSIAMLSGEVPTEQVGSECGMCSVCVLLWAGSEGYAVISSFPRKIRQYTIFVSRVWVW